MTECAKHMLLRNAQNIWQERNSLPDRVANVYQDTEFHAWDNGSRLMYARQLMSIPHDAYVHLAEFILKKHPELDHWYHLITGDDESLTFEWTRFGREMWEKYGAEI